MGGTRLTASDGHGFEAYVARPDTGTKRGLVVIQEIFGVNAHIRRVTDGFAAEGFLAAAPALFDRSARGVELGYDAEGVRLGRAHVDAMMNAGALDDIAATIAWLEAETGNPPAVVGYCWGGAMAWLAATRLNPACAVGYYGRLIIEHNDETPRCPTMLHFGRRDTSIPAGDVDAIRAAHPEVTVHQYDAGHGFNCDARADYDSEAAALARKRTLDFFNAHMKD